MAIKYFIVPVDETEAHLLRQRFSADRQASLYEARFHAAYLLNTGKLKIYTYLDLAEAWGWQASTPRSKQSPKTAMGNALKNRVRRVIDHVSDPSNSWTLLANNAPSDFGVTQISHPSDFGVTQISHHTDKKQALAGSQSDFGVTQISHPSDFGVTIVRARGDALISNTGTDARDQRSEIREETNTPLPPDPGGAVDGQVVTGRSRSRKATEPTSSPGDYPVEFPPSLRARSDAQMLAKLWRDLGRPAARTNFLEVTNIWSAYKSAFPKTRLLGVKDYRYLDARLEEGRVADPPITVEDLRLVPQGARMSAFHMGENDLGKTYTSVETLFRDLKKVEAHIARARGIEDEDEAEIPASVPPPAPPPLVPVQRNIDRERATPQHTGGDPIGKALLDFAGRRMYQDGKTRDAITAFIQALIDRHGRLVVVAAVRSWKDDPQEEGDDKSDISLWLPAKCCRLTGTDPRTSEIHI